MKSLEKLRKANTYLDEDSMDIYTSDNGVKEFLIRGIKTSNELADEIQEEIDKYYLPRPIFDDGEPVQYKDVVAVGKKSSFVVTGLEYRLKTGEVRLISDDVLHLRLVVLDRLKHKIDADSQWSFLVFDDIDLVEISEKDR